MARARKKTSVSFNAITVEGGLITTAMLSGITAREATCQKEDDYNIPKGLALRDEVARYFRIGQALFRDLSASPTPSQSATINFTEALLRDVFCFADIKRTGQKNIEDRIYPVTLEAIDGRVPVVVVTPADDLDRVSPSLVTDGRKRSASSAIQDWLNANEAALWGFCCNGEKIRLVRDNASFTRPAYIEANLRQVFEAENFADFTTLWLLIHSSRFGVKGSAVSDCALEIWRDAGSKEGLTARDRLRDGVETALLSLGNGFLSHPQNTELRKRLENGELPLPDYFNQLLRLVYRLIFLLAAEDRDLLHPPSTPAAIRKLYSEGYSLACLRSHSVRRSAWDRYHDKWEGLSITFAALANGEPRLGLPALSGLFIGSFIPDLEKACLSNKSLMEAVYRLAWLKESSGLIPVNWRDMETEELGSVYESLLELTPRLRDHGKNFGFAEGDETKGNARKTTGSYYTPDSLVQSLLDSTLDPVLDRIEAESEDPIKALLSVTAIDPACGSGHFLLAAARRIASRVARARAGGVASAEDYRHALRDVVRACIYGVDRNPMAVELTKVALWIETVEPGKPLGFLDANIRCGDALLGLFNLETLRQGIPIEAYAPLAGDDKETAKYFSRLNKSEMDGQGTLDFSGGSSEVPTPPPLANTLKNIRALPEDSVKDIAEKKRVFEASRTDPNITKWRTAADIFMSAFLAPKIGGIPTNKKEIIIPTTSHVWLQLAGGRPEERLLDQVSMLCKRSKVFHWPIEFPDVMARGGFDVVVGNPPWDKIQVEDQTFFASRLSEVATAEGQKRKRLIEDLKETNPFIYQEFQNYKRSIVTLDQFAKHGKRYPLTGQGKLNTYALFAELNSSLISFKGRCGCIMPIGIVTDDTTKDFFCDILKSERLVSVFGFENEEFIFNDVHHAFKFVMITVAGSALSTPTKYAFFCRKVADLTDQDRVYNFTAKDVGKMNPNTGNAPIFRSKFDADLNRRIYERVPVLIDEENQRNLWECTIRRMLNPTDDSDLCESDPSTLKYPMPLYEAKMIHQYDHRFGTYDGQTEAQKRQGKLPETTAIQHRDLAFRIKPRHWVEREVSEGYISRYTNRNWQIGYRDITNSVSFRTTIACILPRIPTVDPCRNIYVGENIPVKKVAGLLACLNSLVFDYLARQKVSANHLAIFIFKQLPVLPPSYYQDKDLEFILPRVLELTYTSEDMRSFATDLGYEGNPFKWDDDRRSILKAELDAWHAQAYGLNRRELLYLLDPANVMGADYPSETFRVLKEKEIKEFGEYRTHRLVVEAWDRLFESRAANAAEIVKSAVMPVDITLLPDAAWARPTDGTDASNASLAQLAAIVKALPGPTPISHVRLAALYALEPQYLTKRLSGKERADWQRLIGPAANLSSNITAFSPRISAGWRDAVTQLRGMGAIIEDVTAQTWAPGAAVDEFNTETWPDGRASFALKAINNISLNDATNELAVEDRAWVAANAA